MRDQARAGLSSISELIRQDGQDPEEVWTELSQDVARLAELGLKVECDPSTPLRGGPPVQQDATSEPPPAP
jgi:capsid protein